MTTGSIIDLGSLGGGGSGTDTVGNFVTYVPQLYQFSSNSAGYAINNSGQIVGNSFDSSGAEEAFLWQNRVMTGLGTLGGVGSVAVGINSSGEVVGSAFTNLPATVPVAQEFLWRNGTMTDLSPSGDNLTGSAHAINDLGQVVGSLYNGSLPDEAFLWQNGTLTELGILPGGNDSGAFGINNAGQVVGASSISNLTQAFHAFVWQSGVMTDLGTLGGTDSAAFAVNIIGQVAGFAETSGSAQHAVQWQNGKITDLGTLGGATSCAYAIDSAGQIVGESATSAGATDAFLWLNGTMIDLNSLLPKGSGWELTAAYGINDAGQIVGAGVHNGANTEFLLKLPPSLVKIPSLSSSIAVSQYQLHAVSSPISVLDSAANILSNMSGLEAVAASGDLSSLALTDSGIPTLSVTSTEASADISVLNGISGNFSVAQTASGSNLTISGVVSALGNTVVLSGDASQYTVTPAGDGVHFTVATTGSFDHLNDIQALEFDDFTEIVAPTPGSGGAVTGGNITELYAAVLARVPDVAGLNYYEKEMASNPALKLTTLAQDFLSSPEYTGNSLHNYAQTTAGDMQFITDLYQNLLHRAPAAGDAAWYEANVIAPIVGNATPGTAAYTGALLQAHAAVVTDFSASAEFLVDVQVTAAHPADATHWLVLI